MTILKSPWWFFPALPLGGALALLIGLSAAFIRDEIRDHLGHSVYGAQAMVWLSPIIALTGIAVFAWRRGAYGWATGLTLGGAILLLVIASLPPLQGGMIG